MLEIESFSLTNPQKSIWNMEKYFEGTSINNICTIGIINEYIDEKIMVKALNNIVKNNDCFRIHIKLVNGKPVQYFKDYKPFDIDVIHMKDKNELKDVEKKFAKYKFSINNSRLFSFKIIKFNNGQGAVVLTVNHLISDSWSLGLVIKRILKEYHLLQNNEFLINNNSYIDFINREKEYKKSKRFEADKQFWKDVFNILPDQATFPEKKKKTPKRMSCKAERKVFILSDSISKNIQNFCIQNNISIFNFLFSIYSLYLKRVSGKDDFVVGTPILNRSTFKEKQTMGMFVNTIPIRVNFKEDIDINFIEYLKEFSTKMVGFLKHQKYSYTQILEDLRTENSKVSNLYNVLISYQITKAFNKEYGDYETKWVFNGCCSNDFNIHITDINDTGLLSISYDYLVDKYDEDYVQKLHERIIFILEQIIENKEIKLNNIEIVTEEERKELLSVFNNTNVNYPRNKTIVDLFEEQVNTTPNKIAVVCENEKITYAQLNEKANSLARFLLKNGVKGKDVIGIRIDKSIEMIIGILATIKAGCCYLPINMQYPKDRVEYMLEDSKTNILLGTKESLEELDLEIELNKKKKNNAKIKGIDISLAQSKIYNNNTSNLNIKISPEDLLYIIYTSGSTGKPKGAMICHRNVVRLLKNDKFQFDFSNKDVWTMFHSVAFDFSVWEMYGALLYGGKLVIVQENIGKDPNLFLDLLEEEEVTVLNQTPTYFYNLLNCEIKKAHQNLKIRYIIFGGEALRPNMLLPWRKIHPNTKLINMYGITETTVHVTFKELKDQDLYSQKSNIGMPIPTLGIVLLDKNLKLVPPGVVGEICVCGDGVFKGYLNRDDLNKTKLIQNPYNMNEIIYRSADSGIIGEDYSLEYIGRIDKQVKIRGFRVELGEIEEKILSFKEINSCIVTTKKGYTDHDLLCAYYIEKNNVNLDKIRLKLKQELPTYMIPQYFVKVSKWPLNHNGKIDVNSLPDPKYQNLEEKIVLPRNKTDLKLVEILKKILNIEKISIDNSFFNLGGDSLSAINLCAEIQDKFKVQLFVKDIIDNPIIQDISDMISNSKTLIQKLEIKKVEEAEFYNVSSAQKRIYFATQMAGNDSVIYNVPGGVILEGKVDIKKLEKHLNDLISRHESLRTYFELDNENVVQKISKKINFKLDVVDRVNFIDLDRLFKDFVKPFDLSKAPLFRARFIKFTNGKSALFIDMHHIISDGTSLEILTDELCKLYKGEELPELEITYKDFTEFENLRLESGEFKKAEQFWVEKFKDNIPILNMPTNYSRPAVQDYKGKKIYTRIDKVTAQKIEVFSKEIGATPYITLLSAYYILLSKYTSQDDITIGTPIVGRDIAKTSNVIGMFVNTLALRNKVDNKISFKKFVRNIKENIFKAYKFQTYPFDELINVLNIKRDTSRNPLFDTMFLYQNKGYKEINLPGIKSEYYIPDTRISKFDLSIEVIPTNNGDMSISFEYATKLFKEEFIQHLSEHYINIIKEVIDNVDIKIEDINMLSNAERDRIVYGFNQTECEYPKDKTISELFEKQVSETPDKIALVFGEEQLTYKQLDEKSNKLAIILREKYNIGRNDLIGIMVNRSIEMIVAIIAVLKAGGAYIPIDPSYPEDRIYYMLGSSKAKVLLTQKHLESKIEYENKLAIDLDEELYNEESENDILDDEKQRANTKLNISKPDDLAYLIFTSGSTGLPKGVLLQQRNIINFIYGMIKKFKFTDNDTIASITTMSFDIFVLESLMPLLNGMKVVIANEEEQTNVKSFNEMCIKNNVNIVQTTPSRIQTFMLNNNYLDFMKNATHILIGGEPFPKNLLNEIKVISKCKIYNMYGPTETAVWSTLKDLTNVQDITIGKPIINTQVYNLDQNLKPQPIGVPGDLYISGDGVSKGYLNNEEKTNESFISNPFIKGTLMYKTGDLAKFEEDGQIICLGRSDNQVKIRGLRIELEEIESLILKYPNIKKACVVKQTINNREFISSYYVSDKRIVIKELRKYLLRSLPRYMIPTYYTALEDFPYTPNGKIDKKSLPLPAGILKGNKDEYIAPKTKLQKEIVKIWEDILETKPIGINDNFFELGGDSLLAMNLNIELLKLSDKITYQDIFRYPTISEIEEKINLNENQPLFSKIENLSETNLDILNRTIKRKKIKNYSPKGVLLTGATGFLGAHVLEECLKIKDAKIYCIIRKEPGITARMKLYQKLNYYFKDKYNDLLDKRIIAVTGDITDVGFGLNQEELIGIANEIDVVINTAANVSHYGNYNDFYNTNVKSVKNIIDFCKSFKKKLYHISTMSVSGRKLDKSYPKNKKSDKKEFRESSLYIGQVLDNVYVRSKFEAESYILDAISRGLDGYILRMGNLMPRYRDGVFQENIDDNSFINKTISFINLQEIPDYVVNESLEYTPIDYAAKAVIKLVTHYNLNNRIFHIYDPKYVPIRKLLKIARRHNCNIKVTPEKIFKERVKEILDKEDEEDLLKSLINDLDNDLHLDYKTDIILKSEFSNNYLRKTFFRWPRISEKYIIRLLQLINNKEL